LLSTRFISKEKSRKLVKEIMTHTSNHPAKQCVCHITFDYDPKRKISASITLWTPFIMPSMRESKSVSDTLITIQKKIQSTTKMVKPTYKSRLPFAGMTITVIYSPAAKA